MNSASEQTTASNERARSPFGFLRKNAEPAVAAPTPAPAGDQPSARPAESPFGFLRKNAALAVAAPVGDQPVVKPAVSPFAFLSKSSQLKQAQQVEEVVGRLVSFRTVNDWAVGTVYTKNNEQVSVTGGALIGLTEGIEYSFSGSWKSHPKHGDAFQVGDVQVHLTLDIDSMTKYIVAVFKGIGQARATQFLDAARKRGGDEELERIRQVLVRRHPNWTCLPSASGRSMLGRPTKTMILRAARRSTVTWPHALGT